MVARILTKVPAVVVLAAMASCGSPPSSWNAGADGGNGGGTGTGSSGGDGNNGYGSFVDGGGNPTLTATGQSCLAAGTTRKCCALGIQTCGGPTEFMTWGPCFDANGAPLTCGGVSTCARGEISTACDGGGSSGGGSSGGGNFPDGAPPGSPSFCTDARNTEPEILVAYSPGAGQSVGSNGQIKVWVNDEHPPFISPGEQVDATTGLVTAPGNRTAAAPDGLLWEPALYIAPQTPQSNGTPYFPQWVKGWYNNAPPSTTGGYQVPGMDPPPTSATLAAKYTSEYIWNVTFLTLAPGTYTGVFVIHDGDRDRAIGCVSITVT